jgi:predicted outer membrane repeat protein
MRDGGLSYGGALYAGGGSRLQVEDCTFSDNAAEMSFPHLQTYGLGGAIYAGAGTFIGVRRSTFQGNFAGGFEGGPGGAIYSHELASIGFEDCSFDQNIAGQGGGVCAAGSVTIRRCLFAGNEAQGGSGVSCGSHSLIEQSVFFDNLAWLWDGTIYAAGSVEVRHNTVAFNTTSGGGVGGILLTADAAIVENNIIADNDGIGLQCGGAPAPGAIACNDLWMNGGGNYGGPDLTGIDGNISLDPRFCDAAARELTIRDDSPCAPEAGPCGLIGALGVNCTVLAVSEHDPENTPPQAVHLLPPRPNPASLPVQIVFEVSTPTSIHLGIYAASGRRMATLADGVVAAGRHELTWPAGAGGRRLELAAGVYFITLDAGSWRETERFILVR